MNWFDQLRRALQAYYPPDRDADIVGYLQGSDSPDVWRSMEMGTPSRQQMIVLGGVEPNQEEWVAAGVAQRGQVREIRLTSLSGMIVLYGGFMLRPGARFSSRTTMPSGVSRPVLRTGDVTIARRAAESSELARLGKPTGHPRRRPRPSWSTRCWEVLTQGKPQGLAHSNESALSGSPLL